MNTRKLSLAVLGAVGMSLAATFSHAADQTGCVVFEKTANVNSIPLGGEIMYTFTVTNNPNDLLSCGIGESGGKTTLLSIYDTMLSSDNLSGRQVLVNGEQFSRTVTYTPSVCGELKNTATAEWLSEGNLYTGSDSATVNVLCENNVGTGTPGYWKNHPSAWPVSSITIGGISYPKRNAIIIMSSPVSQDKTITMFKALVSTKLNLLMGTNGACISNIATIADAWMTVHPAGSGVKAKSPAWTEGEPLSWSLDDYNNGKLCAPHRN